MTCLSRDFPGRRRCLRNSFRVRASLNVHVAGQLPCYEIVITFPSRVVYRVENDRARDDFTNFLSNVFARWIVRTDAVMHPLLR
jgi:hypothetical protein